MTEKKIYCLLRYSGIGLFITSWIIAFIFFGILSNLFIWLAFAAGFLVGAAIIFYNPTK